MGLMLPKPTDLGVVDLAFLIRHGKRVTFPGTGFTACMVEVQQETIPETPIIGTETGTLLYIYNIRPKDLKLKEAK